MSALRSKQCGLTSVEFSIVGLVVFIIIFGAIEMGRFMFTLNTLREATYRGARLAAVCTLNHPNIANAAIFNTNGTGSVLPNLSTGNIDIQYLNGAGIVLGNPGGDPAQFSQIRFVRVQIIDYTHNFFLPGASFTHTAQSYPVTLPSESLGVPPFGQVTTCT